MNSVKILHCADIHIGAAEGFLGAAAAERRFETVMTFEKIIDTAKENEVKVIAIAGDLFNSNAAESGLTAPVFEKIASAPEIKVVFAAGNHDPLSADSPFLSAKLPDNLYVLPAKDACIVFEELKLRVYGKSFENVYMQGEEAFSLTPPDDDFINLMVLHGELRSDLGSLYNSVTPEFIKSSRMDYIALGHIHKRTETAKLKNTCFAYCGCPEGQGFDETGEKGVYIGEIGKGFCGLEFVPLSKRQHVCLKTDVSGLRSASEVSAKILDGLKAVCGDGYRNNLYKIELTGSLPEDTRLNLTEITGRVSEAVYYAKIKDCTENETDLKELSGEVSLKGIFVKNMLRRIESASEAEKPELEYALKLGLKAFGSEVAYSED